MTLLESEKRTSLEMVEEDLESLVLKQEQGNLERGGLKTEFEKIAAKSGLAFNTVKRFYYQDIKKNKVKKEEEHLEPERVISFEGLNLKLYLIEGEEFFVAREVFELLGINRSSKMVREVIREEDKKYIPIKNNYGIMNTSIVKVQVVKKLIDSMLNKKSNVSEAKKMLFIIERDMKSKPVEKREEKLNIDESIKSYSQRSSQSILKNDASEVYKYGDVIEVIVTNIAPYGVLCETLDGLKTQGLLHISEVRNTFVQDLLMYFEVGDKIKAKVKLVSDNKLQLSTKDFKLPLKNPNSSSFNPFAEKLSSFKETLEERKKEVVEETLEVKEISKKPVVGTPIENHTESKLFEGFQNERELEHIVKFISSKVGALSPVAKEELIEKISNRGIVPFVIAMTEVAKSFENDLGVQLIREIDKRMDDCL